MKHLVKAVVVAGVFLIGTGLQGQESPPESRASLEGGMPAGMHEGRRGPAGRSGGEGPMRGAGKGLGGIPGILADRIVSDPEVAKKLELSQEQIATIKDKLSSLKQSEVKLNADIEAAAKDQVKQWTTDKISESEVMASIEKLGNLRTQFAKLQAQKMLVFKQTLTADQMKKIREVLRHRLKERKDAAQGLRPEGEKLQKRMEHGKGAERNGREAVEKGGTDAKDQGVERQSGDDGNDKSERGAP